MSRCEAGHRHGSKELAEECDARRWYGRLLEQGMTVHTEVRERRGGAVFEQLELPELSARKGVASGLRS